MRKFIDGKYLDMTNEEIAQLEISVTPEMKIEALKQNLINTDYKAIKYAEGLINEEDYAPIRTQRQEWRDEINRIETEI